MVSNRCKIIVKSELKKLGLHCVVELGEIEIRENISEDQRNQLDISLKKCGFALIENNKSILIEKVKNIIIELVHYAEEPPKTNFSCYLSEKLNYNYTYLANVFKENEGITVELFFLTHKIERIKELLIYDELTISEIANKLNYSSLSHLSNQFKKMTGLTPSQYKHLKHKRRQSLENV